MFVDSYLKTQEHCHQWANKTLKWMQTRSIQFEIAPPIWILDELNSEESLSLVIVLQSQPCFNAERWLELQRTLNKTRPINPSNTLKLTS